MAQTGGEVLVVNHLVWLILDSCRYDSFLAASTPNFDRLGQVELRYSYASWTAPSHLAFLMGLTPHRSPAGRFASEVYADEFAQWGRRLGVETRFEDFVPELSLPCKLRKLGYATLARVSLPVLNPRTLLSRYFDDYRLMERYDQFAAMVEELEFGSQPMFVLLNLGETHYPYLLEDAPRLAGLHGAARGAQAPGFFVAEEMERMRLAQIRAVERVDRLFAGLLAKAPAQTHFIVCADHGELFGEDGFFGHGPVMHPKVFEVPFLEGRCSDIV